MSDKQDLEATLVLGEYTWTDAVRDRVLYPFARESWTQLSGNRPILMSSSVHAEVGPLELMEIWNDFVAWNKYFLPIVPEDERLFRYYYDEKVVVVEPGKVFIIKFEDE